MTINRNFQLAAKPNINPYLSKFRASLRIEVPQYTGSTLSLAGRYSVTGEKITIPKHKDYDIELLLRNGVLQPTLTDAGVPTVASYTYDKPTMTITFSSSLDFTTPIDENIIILLR